MGAASEASSDPAADVRALCLLRRPRLPSTWSSAHLRRIEFRVRCGREEGVRALPRTRRGPKSTERPAGQENCADVRRSPGKRDTCANRPRQKLQGNRGAVSPTRRDEGAREARCRCETQARTVQHVTSIMRGLIGSKKKSESNTKESDQGIGVDGACKEDEGSKVTGK